MVERKVTVNPRASAVVITNSPNHVKVNQDGIKKLKNEVRMNDCKSSKKLKPRRSYLGGTGNRYKTIGCNKFFTK